MLGCVQMTPPDILVQGGVELGNLEYEFFGLGSPSPLPFAGMLVI